LILKVLVVLSACFSAFILVAPPSYCEQQLAVQPISPKQGQTVAVLIRDSGASTGSGAPSVEFNGRTYKAFPVESSDGAKNTEGVQGGANVYRALIGVPALIKPGTYKVKSGESVAQLTVQPAKFGVQRIRLPKGKDHFNGSPGEQETVEAAKKTLSETQLWQGKFKYPCKGRTSASFGLRRAVNGKLLEDYFHSGVDFAAPTGTPVYAPQKGKVIIAHNGWKLHGNTVSIDHGQGVVSFCIHLSKIFVKEGQLVNAGDKIGAVGQTGRASGPHLHFSIYVNNDATNPADWFAKKF
jgi:murein DD-endopeptidase MepM/ murein hydrolase activator NlpD